MAWLGFALLSVCTWGVYGLLLHTGTMGMADPANGRYKAFLFVGLAYLLVAVIGPLVVLKVRGVAWGSLPAKGVAWSTIAGLAGAIGAFGILLAFSAKGTPAVVMSIVFAGAPVVNAIVAMILHPPSGGLRALDWRFVVGIAMAAVGGCLVTLFRPA
ncbi:MAG: hypothetical protein U0610_19230 [bacterium]